MIDLEKVKITYWAPKARKILQKIWILQTSLALLHVSRFKRKNEFNFQQLRLPPPHPNMMFKNFICFLNWSQKWPKSFSKKVNKVKILMPVTGPWRPSIGMVTDPWPFIMSSLVKIRPKMRPRTLTNREISQKLPNRDSCDYRTVTPTYGHHPHPTTIHHTKFGWDPT